MKTRSREFVRRLAKADRQGLTVEQLCQLWEAMGALLLQSLVDGRREYLPGVGQLVPHVSRSRRVRLSSGDLVMSKARILPRIVPARHIHRQLTVENLDRVRREGFNRVSKPKSKKP